MNLKRAAAGVLVIIVLLAGGYLLYRQFFARDAVPEAIEATLPADAADTVAVRADAGTVTAEGHIAPLRHALLAFTGGGPVVEIAAPEGTTVAAGDPLLRLDAADQTLALLQAEAAAARATANEVAARASVVAAELGVQVAELDVSAAEARLALATAAPLAEQLALGESNVALAEARVAQAAAAQALVLEGVQASRIRAAEADLRAAEAAALAPQLRLDELRRQESPDAEDLAQAEREYNAALAGIEAARAAVDELRAGATDAQRGAAAGGVAAAAAQRDAAAAELELLQAGGSPEAVAAAEAGVSVAQAALDGARARVSAANAAGEQAAAEVDAAQSAVEAARVALDKRTLVAPFAGTVAAVTVDLGEVAGAGLPVVTLADFSGWLVETTDLSELDVVAVAAGDPAEARADALPDAALSGAVVDIAGVAGEVRGDILYTVTIRLDDAPDVPLRWGMTVFVTIDTSGL